MIFFKPSFLLFLFFFISSEVFAQDSSIVKIRFNSDFEKTAFENFKNDSIDYFSLFSGVDKKVEDVSSAKKEFNELIDYLNKYINRDAKKKKIIKFVYQNVHNKFLRKYDEENYFSEIFSTGNYNCVGASALYALVFEELDIPYNIKETPTHVYLVAYPKSDPIKIETTDPMYGYFQVTEAFQKQFVSYLTNNKLIGESEASLSSTKELFNKYYYSDNNINLDELIGIQYSNDAIYKYNEKEYEEAFYQLLKAKEFNNSDKTNFLLNETAAVIVNDNKLSEIEDFELSLFIWQQDVNGANDDFIQYKFIKLLQDKLVSQSDEVAAENFYNRYIGYFKDNKTILEKVSFAFYYEKGRQAFNNGRHSKAKVDIEKAYKINPNHAEVKSLLAHNIVRTTVGRRLSKKVADALEEHIKTYPFLNDNMFYKSILAESYLVSAVGFFMNKEQEEGMIYVEKFESLYDEDLTMEVDEEQISDVYIQASKYHFRKRNMEKVKEFLNKALEINPDSEEAKRRMEEYF